MASRPACAPYLAALALFAAAGSIAACDDPSGLECTAMGCQDAVSVTLEELPLDEVDRLPITIEICDGPTCATTTISPDGHDEPTDPTCISYEHWRCCSTSPTWSPCTITNEEPTVRVAPDPSRMKEPRSIHVVVKAGDGSVLLDASPAVTPTAHYANGPLCDAVPCYGAHALLTVGGS